MPDYQQLQQLAEAADKALGAINSAAEALVAAGTPAATLQGMLSPLGEASERITDIAAWGRAARAAPAPVKLVSFAPDAPADLRAPPLSGDALRAALTGRTAGDRYDIPGVEDPDVARAYVNDYQASGSRYNPTLVAVAGMSAEQFEQLQRAFPTPADWYNAQRLHASFRATLPTTWPDLAAAAGR